MQNYTTDSDSLDSEPPRHRPIIPVLAGFAAGIAADNSLRPPFLFWLGLGVCLIVITLWASRRDLKPWGNWTLAVILLIPIGGAYHQMRYRQKPAYHLENLPIKERSLFHVRARVLEPPGLHYRQRALAPENAAPSSFWMVRVELKGLSCDGQTWHPAAGGLAVFVDAGRPRVTPGETVEFMSRISKNQGPTNPGERNMARIYRRTGSHGTASVSSPGAFQVVSRSPWYDPSVAMGRLRAGMKKRLIWNGPVGGGNGLTAALIFGERGRITPDIEQTLKDSGALHFLAISGLHVGIYAGFVWLILLSSGCPVQIRSLALIGLVWLYVLFTGAHVSALRAGCMVTFAVAAPLVRRRHDFLSALCAAALTILLVNPTQLFSSGFQFSFMAVWAIVYLYAQLAPLLWPWESFVQRVQSPQERTFMADTWFFLRHAGLLSLSLWAAMAPIRVYHFHRISLWAPFLYLLLWPLVLGLLLSVFLLAFWAMLFLPGLSWVAYPASVFSGSLADLLRFFEKAPAFVHFTPGPPLWWVLLFYVAVTLWVMRKRVARGRHAFIAVVLVLALTYIWNDFGHKTRTHFRMTVMDVGPGQAVLMSTADGRNMLYDAGSRTLSKRRAVAEVLWHKRASYIDPLVISHRNFDHLSFVPYLARRFNIGRILLPPTSTETSLGSRLKSDVRSHGILCEHLLEEETRIAGGGLMCRVLHPNKRFATNPTLSANERSAVLLCSVGRLQFMLTGDLGPLGMSSLCDRYGRSLDVDLLFLPHHGHHARGLERFLQNASPAVAVASCAHTEETEKTRKILRRMDVPLWSTARDGAVLVKLDRNEARITGCASGRSRVLHLGPDGRAHLSDTFEH